MARTVRSTQFTLAMQDVTRTPTLYPTNTHVFDDERDHYYRRLFSILPRKANPPLSISHYDGLLCACLEHHRRPYHTDDHSPNLTTIRGLTFLTYLDQQRVYFRAS